MQTPHPRPEQLPTHLRGGPRLEVHCPPSQASEARSLQDCPIGESLELVPKRPNQRQVPPEQGFPSRGSFVAQNFPPSWWWGRQSYWNSPSHFPTRPDRPWAPLVPTTGELGIQRERPTPARVGVPQAGEARPPDPPS